MSAPMIVTAEVIHDPVDGFVAVVYCPECDGAYGVQSDADLLVAAEHIKGCAETSDIREWLEIQHLDPARTEATERNAR